MTSGDGRDSLDPKIDQGGELRGKRKFFLKQGKNEIFLDFFSLYRGMKRRRFGLSS